MKKFLPLLVLLLCTLGVVATLLPPANKTDFDLVGLSQMPVLANGRIKPLDSVARSSLLMLQGRQSVRDSSGRSLSPTEWLLDVMLRPEIADKRQVFEITNPELLALFTLREEDGAGKKRFSLAQLRPKLDELERQARLASQVESNERNSFQRAVLQLQSGIGHYQRLSMSLMAPETTDMVADLNAFAAAVPAGVAAVRAKQEGKPFDEKANKDIMAFANRYSFFADNAFMLPIPPATGAPRNQWRPIGAATQEIFETGQLNTDVLAYAHLTKAWQTQNKTDFNDLVRLYRARLNAEYAAEVNKVRIEALFNSSQPFYTASILFVLAFLAAVLSWIFWQDTLSRGAFWITALAFALTTAGILARMWLENRPPVTNLYSSALFVGWVAVGMCLFIERIFKNAVGSMAAGFVGFCTLVIAHHLATSGDTMEMMRAVLDSNFWLATHVVTITMGYAATFLAGAVGLVYIVAGFLTKRLDKSTGDNLERIVYGVLCFATFFSLVGTILGGIWADQSWGRFWGWDPKENGALIIVIWNAIYLHARWGRLFGQRGLIALAVFGNVVTSWSWFGTNMLGVGLHSYGFMDSAFYWLLGFVLSQVAFILVCSLPETSWRSLRKSS